MLTFLFMLALAGTSFWIMLNRFKTSPRSRPSTIAVDSPSNPPLENKWKWLREKGLDERLKSVGIALFVFMTFNFALFAGMSEFQDKWGRDYFLDSWMWSGVFWLLAIIICALAWGQNKKESGKRSPFALFIIPIAVIAVIATANAVLPGFFGTEKAKAEKPRDVVVITGLPNKLTFDPADSLPEITDSLIEIHFGDLDDGVVRTMKRIAFAESGGNHFKPGTEEVLRGTVNSQDIGLFQINADHHQTTCWEAGLDIFELEGNVRCARLLYDRRGTRDWYLSAYKWRDNFAEKPGHWSFDRTPGQIVAASRREREVVIIDAPTDTWSVVVGTYNRHYCFQAVGSSYAYEIIDELGKRDTIMPGKILRAERYPKTLEFHSLGEEPLKVVFTRVSQPCST